MKKIFVLTGEPSGDKLASTAISKLQKDYTDIKYLSVGGSNLRKIGIESIFDLKEACCIFGFCTPMLRILSYSYFPAPGTPLSSPPNRFVFIPKGLFLPASLAANFLGELSGA